jgi:hypothetical protein
VTSKDQEILSGASSIGKKKILVFYEGRTPNDKKADWIMHEYHLCQKELDGNNPDQVGCLSCLLFLLVLHFFLIAQFLLANCSVFTLTSSKLLSFSVFVQNTKIMSHTMRKIPDLTSSTQLETQRIRPL